MMSTWSIRSVRCSHAPPFDRWASARLVAMHLKSPWEGITAVRDSYVLDHDSPCVHRNARGAEELRIIAGSIPEPFIGDPRKAKVIFLGLNPGHNEDDQW